MTSLLSHEELLDDLSVWPLPSGAQERLPFFMFDRMDEVQKDLTNGISHIFKAQLQLSYTYEDLLS